MRTIFETIGKIFLWLVFYILDIILLPIRLLSTIYQTVVACIAIFPFRFVSFFGFIGYRNSYKFWKILNIIVFIIPFILLTVIEFFVLLIELLFTKCISNILYVVLRLELIHNFIFGVLTFLMVKFFELLHFAMLLPDIIPYGTRHYIQNNPITVMYEDIGRNHR